VKRVVLVALCLAVPAMSCGDRAASSGEPSVANTAPPTVAAMTVEILETVPHDVGAFTEGLVFDERGRLFESTGLEGGSTLRELEPRTGDVLRQVPLAAEIFAEGLALVGDRLVQITWKNGDAFVYDRETFELVATFEYAGEGWGLCYDGTRLVMSDGTDTLTFRDPTTFEATGNVRVTMAGAKVELLNELECAAGKVYANIFRSDLIAIIDPSDGQVDALIDASALVRPKGADVLNGIAVDPNGDLWLTGKWWDSMYRVRPVTVHALTTPVASSGCA
jgi:glutaminyl-peptide cyclotransferase